MRGAPSSPTTGTAQPWQRPVAQISGSSRAIWLQAPCSLGGRGDGVQEWRRAGGVDDVGGGALEDAAAGAPSHGPAQPDRAVAGDHRHRAGGPPGLQRGEQVGLVGRGEDQRHRAPALAQPLGQREERRGGMPVADQHAG